MIHFRLTTFCVLPIVTSFASLRPTLLPPPPPLLVMRGRLGRFYFSVLVWVHPSILSLPLVSLTLTLAHSHSLLLSQETTLPHALTHTRNNLTSMHTQLALMTTMIQRAGRCATALDLLSSLVKEMLNLRSLPSFCNLNFHMISIKKDAAGLQHCTDEGGRW